MLSSVLRSETAIRVNIQIMRTFVKLKRAIASNAELARKLNALEQRVEGHDVDMKYIFEAIRQLLQAPAEPPVQIKAIPGFRHAK